MQRYVVLSLLFVLPTAIVSMNEHQQELNIQLANAVQTNAQPRDVVCIINQGAHPNSGIVPAIANGNTRLLKLLIVYGANIHGCNNALINQQKQSLYSTALKTKKPTAKKIIKILAARGLKPTKQDYIASCLLDFNAIDQLINYGINPDTAVDSYNHTALMGLVTSYSRCTLDSIKKLIKTLVTLEADIDCTNIDGKTALMLCVEEAHLPHRYAIAKLLLAYGANPIIKDNVGNTALEYTTNATPLAQLISDSIYRWINRTTC